MHSLLIPLAALALSPTETLWYDTPASQWEETLPVGNGRLGMMPDGDIHHERVVLNDITMWSGCEYDYSNPEAATSLPEIRSLLMQGRNAEAQQLMYDQFVPRKPETGGTYGSYQVLADLDIEYSYPGDGEVTEYCRWLDLDRGSACTTYTKDGVTYRREYIVPRDSHYMLVHCTADTPGAISLRVSLRRDERGESGTIASPSGQTIATLGGTLDSGDPVRDGVSYQVRAFIPGGDGLSVSEADEAWIVVTASTTFPHPGNPPASVALLDPERLPSPDSLARAVETGIEAHRELYRRCLLQMPATGQSTLPTDRRLLAFADNPDDPALAALYFNYARYLLISSTLPSLLPPNLQGLWADGCGTPWNGDYHTNINVQMNHWIAEPANLSELHMPLIDLTTEAVPSGTRTARAFYGTEARGWVMHMMTNPWHYTEPGEHPSWGATNTGGAWLCAHLYEHYLYNPTDTAYLRRIYPVMKGAADFFLSTMVTEPVHDWLVTAPSSSPENAFFMCGDNDGSSGGERQPVSVCMGPTMDTQILTELFTNVRASAQTLGIDTAYCDTLTTAIASLPPMQIGSDGRLMEWLEEYAETDPHHRHVSHLYGLHPGRQITPEGTPALAEACRLTLDARGDGGTGWSRAWKVCFHARLGDGDRAFTLLRSLLQPAYEPDDAHKHRSGTFPNLFCSHPPFQIDGNFGGAAGILEMLVQTHGDNLLLLPALPSAWPEGSISGVRLPGGDTISFSWKDGEIEIKQ